MSQHKPTLLVAGGGTGGHILAGVAVADAWKEKYGKDARILFVGAKGGLEEKLVPRSGYPLELLQLGSLKRVSLARRLKTMVQLPLALLKSLKILIQERPDAVIGVGGYASGPMVLMASFFTRSAIVEQNSIPGLTNRILGKFAKQVFCAFPGALTSFSSTKAVVTGNPIRMSMRLLPAASRDPFTIFIFGGSQGALGMNTLVIEALPHLKDLTGPNGRVRFIHQAGEVDFERVSKAHQEAGTGARVEKFVYDMPSAYSEASLLICRAGASTLSEIAAVGRAAILVPLPTAADNHQEKNARMFVDAGAALLAVQKRTSGEDLALMIRTLVRDTTRVEKMEKAVTTFHKPGAAQTVVERLS